MEYISPLRCGVVARWRIENKGIWRERRVNLRSETAVVADLHELLEMAEQHHRALGEAGEFRDSLLQVLLTQFSAQVLRLWDIRSSGQFSLCAEIGQSEPRDPQLVLRESRTNVVRQIADVQTISGRSAQVYLSSAEIADGLRIVFELRSSSESIRHQLLSDLCEVFADLYRRRLVAGVVQHADREQYFRQLIELVHSDLDENRIANTLASDAAEFLKCRRVAVARRITRNRWELLAATSVNDPDPRSDAVRYLCRLVQDAATAETDSAADQPVAIQDVPAAEKQDATAAEKVLVRPLSISQKWADADWAIVFEQWDQLREPDAQQYLQSLCQHATTAFSNSQALKESSGWSSIRNRLRAFREGRMLIVVAVSGLLLLWCLLRPAELRIEVPGQLVPVERRYLFAPDQGIITALQVQDGSEVQAGDMLCTLRNDDLELQLERLRGEMASARARLAALESLRGDRSLSQSSLVSGEQAELTEKTRSLELQIEFLKKRLSRLTLFAPISGHVHGERIREALLGRPVARGQYLFEIANTQGAWELELRVSELDVRHVKAAISESPDPLLVTFALETSPERSMQTTLLHLNDSTDVDERGQLSTRASAEFPGDKASVVSSRAESLELRPGAGVIASVHCGTRTAGFVYFRKLIEFLQRRL